MLTSMARDGTIVVPNLQPGRSSDDGRKGLWALVRPAAIPYARPVNRSVKLSAPLMVVGLVLGSCGGGGGVKQASPTTQKTGATTATTSAVGGLGAIPGAA